jgi:phosphatidylglycerol---prolipoprotein diacylglyceryl transferase
MHPRLYTLEPFDFLGRNIGPFTLPTYGVLLAIAFMAGLWVVSRQAKRSGLDANRITDLAVYVLIAGLVGAKVLLVIVEWRYYAGHPADLVSILQSGGVFYGGLLAAFPVAWWYVVHHQLDGWKTADVLAPGVAIGQAIGRLGCFAAGCCHGRPTHVPWAVTFRDMYAARTVGTPIDVPLHPTQLYESAATLAIFAFLIWLLKRKRFDGQVVLAYVVLYSVARFTIEFFRGDSARGFVLGGLLSTSQSIAIVLVLGAGALWPYLVKRRSAVPA